MIKDYTHLFSVDHKKYAFDSDKLIYASLDDITYDLLSCLKKQEEDTPVYHRYGKEAAEESSHALHAFIDQGFFFSEDAGEMQDDRQYKTAYFTLPTVHRCNFNCRYCFAGAGRNFEQYGMEFQPEMLKRAMDYLYFELFPNVDVFRLDFVSGGEPLLNFDSIRECVKIGRELYQKTGRKLDIWLCTNGSINKKEYWDFLNENHIGIGISMDGCQTEHDKNRVDLGGLGTYETVRDTLRHILSHDAYTPSFRNVWGLSVITGDTPSIVEILKHHRKLGISRMQMKFVRLDKEVPFSINQNTIQHIKQLYYDLVQFLKSSYDAGDLSYLYMIGNQNDYFGKILCRLILREKYHTRCYAGKCKVSITASGQIYPCDSFVGRQEYCLGDIEHGIDEKKREAFYDCTVYTREPCAGCFAKHICGGDCLHNSLLVNGDFYVCDDLFCDFMRYAVELCIDLIQHISEGQNAQKLYRFLKMQYSI